MFVICGITSLHCTFEQSEVYVEPVINSILSKFAQLSSAEFLFLMVHMLQLAFLRVRCIMCTHVEINQYFI